MLINHIMRVFEYEDATMKPTILYGSLTTEQRPAGQWGWVGQDSRWRSEVEASIGFLQPLWHF